MTMEYYSSSGCLIKVTSRRYYGSLMIEGSKRPRIYNPYGYIDVVRNDSAVYCFASVDRLGSVRAVTDLNGKLVQSMDYYSTGLPYSDVEAPLDDIHLYEGKPYIGLRSMGLYDNKARIYDAVNGRFNAPDALAWKYPHLSPYLSCAANPLLYIDHDGNDICILITDIHMAMLIQNENRKWQYYSINGDKMFKISSGKSGRPFNDIAIGEWSSPQDFLNSDYNRNLEDIGREDQSVNNFGYTKGFIIQCTPEQDSKVAEEFKYIAENFDYNLKDNNCATTVQYAMKKAGLKTNLTMPIHPITGEFMPSIYESIISIPTNAYISIKSANPNGKEILQSKNK